MRAARALPKTLVIIALLLVTAAAVIGIHTNIPIIADVLSQIGINSADMAPRVGSGTYVVQGVCRDTAQGGEAGLSDLDSTCSSSPQCFAECFDIGGTCTEFPGPGVAQLSDLSGTCPASSLCFATCEQVGGNCHIPGNQPDDTAELTALSGTCETGLNCYARCQS